MIYEEKRKNKQLDQNICSIYKSLLKTLFHKNILNLVMSILGALILSVSIILSSWLVQQSIDFVSGQGNITFPLLIFIVVINIMLVAAAGVCVYHFRTNFTVRAVQQYREYAVDIILQKDIADFKRHTVSSYLSAMTNDVNMIKENFLDQLPIIIQILICAVGAVALMIYYNPLLTVIALIISLVPTLAAMKSGEALAKADIGLSGENAQYMGKLSDILNGFGVIKSCIAGIGMRRTLSAQNTLLKNKLLIREKKLEKINYYAAVSGYITQFAVLLVCVYFAVFKKSISAGTIVVFTRLMTYIIDPVTNLPEMFSNVRASMGMMKKFAELLYSEKRKSTYKAMALNEDFHDAIVLKNVFFTYENEKIDVLHDWNITFEKGKKYVIVGASGSGKSTLFNLLLHTYSPTQGEILIDGTPFYNLTMESLYRTISIVYQKNFIFNDTLLNNLTLFRDVSEQDIKNAVRRADLEDIIEKRGLDYICGEEGANLSGGECQRIAIARSYLCHTPILLFDEATSALDKQTSSNVLRKLLSNPEETVIAITHVLEQDFLKRCDVIITVDNGHIAEIGGFENLVQKKGYFYSLYTASQEQS